MTPITLLQKKLRSKKIPCLIVSNPENRRFISGYTAQQDSIIESTGYLLIPAKGPCFLLTDSRFTLQAQTECPDFELIIYTKGFFHSLRKLLLSLGIKKVAFESDYFLHSHALLLGKMAKDNAFTLLPTTDIIGKLRLCKRKADLAKIRHSVLLNEKVFQKIYRRLKPGITEIKVALKIEALMRELGADRPSFSTIVASGSNGALPHATPSNRKLQLHEPVVIDMGLVLDGLCSDMTRTIVLGAPDSFTRKIFSIVRKAQLKAADQLHPGVPCSAIDKTARDVIRKKGYGKQFGHSLGHGVGYAIHEAPSLSTRCHKKLSPGMIVTVEPGIYIPDWGGVRLENMYAITHNGSQLLNNDTTCLDIGSSGPL